MESSDADMEARQDHGTLDSCIEDAPLIPSPASQFAYLPTEVHEAILDHLFGYRVSTTSSSNMMVLCTTRSWGNALRHSRRRELTELARVTQLWRELIQQRLYRHVKIKATTDSMTNAMLHFTNSPHLKSYVKHVELWFPVFQPTYGPQIPSNSLTLPTVTTEGLTNATYTLPANNCSLDEVFNFVKYTLPQVNVLTLEGGERRKAPKVAHFSRPSAILSPGELPVLNSVGILVTRGQWNLMRDNCDFDTVLEAMPNLREWQSSYSKPKAKSYVTMGKFFHLFPQKITNFNLCLESDYRREGIMPGFYSKAMADTHLCPEMGRITTSLEHFTYTGRICHDFFQRAFDSVDSRVTRLKSIDITVKNCCRPIINLHESGSGIQDASFIDAFEELVLAGIRSLEKLKQVQYLRIRFVDLGLFFPLLKHRLLITPQQEMLTLQSPVESALPNLNPYFLLRNSKCTGVWSEAIVDEMQRVRPAAEFEELSDTFGTIGYTKDGRMTIAPEPPRTKITSLRMSNYRQLATRITIQ